MENLARRKFLRVVGVVMSGVLVPTRPPKKRTKFGSVAFGSRPFGV